MKQISYMKFWWRVVQKERFWYEYSSCFGFPLVGVQTEVVGEQESQAKRNSSRQLQGKSKNFFAIGTQLD